MKSSTYLSIKNQVLGFLIASSCLLTNSYPAQAENKLDILPSPFECHSEHIGNSLDPACVYDACVNCWVSGYFYECSGGSSGEEGYTTDCECSMERPVPSPFNFPKFLLIHIEEVCKNWAFSEDRDDAIDPK